MLGQLWTHFAGVLRPNERFVDNNRLARDVVYHTIAAAERINGIFPWDSAAVHDFVRERIRYHAELDPMDQRLRMPWRALDEGVGDCKTTAIMIGALAKASGRDVTLRFLDQTGGGQWDHVFAIVDGLAVDPLEPLGSIMPHYHHHDERI